MLFISIQLLALLADEDFLILQVLPLENKMINPHHGKGVIIAAMAVTTTLYASFGVLGYLTYGDNLEGSITLNLNSTRVGACM